MREISIPRFNGGTSFCQVDTDPELTALRTLLTSTYRGRRQYVLLDVALEPLVPSLRRTLESPGALVIGVQATEATKTFANCEVILNEILRLSPSKDDLVVNVGGGGLMNVGGFLSGILLRGMDFVHVPTTLTGQIDVCLGGKQAINVLGYKNQVGLYRDPLHCYCNTSFLRHLGTERLKAQLVEGMKLCLARSATEFWSLFHGLDRLDATDSESLSVLVTRLLGLKAPLVESDPFERRAALSLQYGHTVGHAIESTSRGAISHCEAVALGMVIAARISCALKLCRFDLVEVHLELCRRLGLAPKVPAWVQQTVVMEHLRHDKKKFGGQVHFVLLRDIGEMAMSGDAYSHVVAEAVIAEAISATY